MANKSKTVAAPAPATPARGATALTPEVTRSVLADLADYRKTQAMSARTSKNLLAKLRQKP